MQFETKFFRPAGQSRATAIAKRLQSNVRGTMKTICFRQFYCQIVDFVSLFIHLKREALNNVLV